MVLALGQSLSRAAGHQLILFSLILLRRSFEILAELPEPIHWTPDLSEPVLFIGAEAFGALAVFGITGVFHRVTQRRAIVADRTEESRFIALKKVVALALLAMLAALAIESAWRVWSLGEEVRVFERAFTVLIFGDVALVLIALRFTRSYHVLFRNTGFAVCGVLMRLALAAPPPIDAAVGTAAAAFGLGLVWVYGRVAPIIQSTTGEDPADTSGERARLRDRGGTFSKWSAG